MADNLDHVRRIPPFARVADRAGQAFNVRIYLAVGLLLAGLGLRLVNLQDPPLGSAEARQFHSALLARLFYLESSPFPDARGLDVARANAPNLIEPPIMELVAAAGYHLAGVEILWLPRLVALLAWVLGAAFLYLLADRLGFGWGSLAAIVVYLFVPFGILYSRHFMPDPLMIALMVAGLWAIVRSDDLESTSSLVLAGTLLALAVFVKPVSAFILLPAYAALSIRRRGIRGSLTAPVNYLIGALAILPIALYGAVGLALGAWRQGDLTNRITPTLLVTPFFWTGWPSSVVEVLSPPVVLAAAVGMLLVRPGRFRALGAGAAAGYVLYALTFSYYAATHLYYHLPLIPLAGLAVGSLAERLVEDRRLLVPAGVLLVAAVATATVAVWPHLSSGPQASARISTAREIGDWVGHSARTIVVHQQRDRPSWLLYYGEFAGPRWWTAVPPLPGRSSPRRAVPPERSLQSLIRRRKAEFRVVSNPRLVDGEPGLWKILRSGRTVLVETERYVIFTLRSPP